MGPVHIAPADHGKSEPKLRGWFNQKLTPRELSFAFWLMILEVSYGS